LIEQRYTYFLHVILDGQALAPKALVAGANSFTHDEAVSRIESKGYTKVKHLKKDASGVWRGTAMKDGQPVSVSVDYQGNVN
jgi:hypothetical protein